MEKEERMAAYPPKEFAGLTEEFREEIAERVAEFEKVHEAEVRRGGPGWVPRIKMRDYMIAGLVNLVLLVWLLFALV